MSAAKARGTAAETAVVRYLSSLGIPAERRALKGAADEGDVWLWHGRVVIEVKSRRTRPSDEEIARMWQEAMREADRVPQCDVALLVLKRPGKTNPALWWAVMSPTAWLLMAGYIHHAPPDREDSDLLTMSLGHVANLLRWLPHRTPPLPDRAAPDGAA